MDIKWKNIPKITKICKGIWCLTAFVLAVFLATVFHSGNLEIVVDALHHSDYVQSAAHRLEVMDAFETLSDYISQENLIEKSQEGTDRQTKKWEYSVQTDEREVYYDTAAQKKGWDFEYCSTGKQNYLYGRYPFLLSSTKSVNSSHPSGLTLGYWYLYQEGKLTRSSGSNQQLDVNDIHISMGEMDTITVGFTKGVMLQKIQNWDYYCEYLQVLFFSLLLFFVLSLVLWIVRIIMLTESASHNEIAAAHQSNPKLPYDLLSLGIVAAIAFCLFLICHFHEPVYRLVYHSEWWGQTFLCVLLETLCCLAVFLMLEKLITHRGYCYFKDHFDSGFWTGLCFLGKLLSGQLIFPEYYRKSRKWYFILLSVCNFVLALLCIWLIYQRERAAVVVSFVFLGFVLLYHINTLWQLYQYRQLEKQILMIYEGNYQGEIDIRKDSCFAEDIRMLQEIGIGFEQTLQDKIKSERTKVELVTNVSHDLKTPLTSIIGYVDLLSRDANLSEQSKTYVHILGQKADRLKTIVADVYELAKTTSGEITIDKKQLNFNKLIIQVTADMEEWMQQAKLRMKLQLTAEDVMIESDGNRLYRVLQNLIDNTRKYSMQGTRVYFLESIEEERVILKIVNTANYEMDFCEEEVTERFFRGDKSRNSEGSGLGLSIAEGFTLACGGSFRVDIEGDQFKVLLSFPIMRA